MKKHCHPTLTSYPVKTKKIIQNSAECIILTCLNSPKSTMKHRTFTFIMFQASVTIS